jgi:putative endonuclease
MNGFCYILTNKNKTVLYVGATNDIVRRTKEHRNGKYARAFTKRYNCYLLVYFEEFDEVQDAFKRETQLKAGNRKRKEALINSLNPEWKDLSEGWFDRDEDS